MFESVDDASDYVLYGWTYIRIRLKVVETFVYLAVLFDWREDGTAAWADRESTAFKTFGALLGTLFLVPFLPFKRITEIMGMQYSAGELFKTFKIRCVWRAEMA